MFTHEERHSVFGAQQRSGAGGGERDRAAVRLDCYRADRGDQYSRENEIEQEIHRSPCEKLQFHSDLARRLGATGMPPYRFLI